MSIPTGANVGSSRASGVLRPKNPAAVQPREVDAAKLSSASESVSTLLREAEDATVELGRREAERSSLYERAEQREESDLAAKYGVQR